eukprot:403353485
MLKPQLFNSRSSLLMGGGMSGIPQQQQAVLPGNIGVLMQKHIQDRLINKYQQQQQQQPSSSLIKREDQRESSNQQQQQMQIQLQKAMSLDQTNKQNKGSMKLTTINELIGKHLKQEVQQNLVQNIVTRPIQHIRVKSLNLEVLKNYDIKVVNDNQTHKKIVLVEQKPIQLQQLQPNQTLKSLPLKCHSARASQSPLKDFSSGIKNTYDFIKNKVLTKREILVQREERKHESLAGIVIKRDFKSREPGLSILQQQQMVQDRHRQNYIINSKTQGYNSPNREDAQQFDSKISQNKIIFSQHLIQQQLDRQNLRANSQTLRQKEKIKYVNSEDDFETLKLSDINLLSQEKGKFRRVFIETQTHRMSNVMNSNNEKLSKQNNNKQSKGMVDEQEKLRRMKQVRRFKTIMERQKDSFDEFDNEEDISRHIKLLKMSNARKAYIEQQKQLQQMHQENSPRSINNNYVVVNDEGNQVGGEGDQNKKRQPSGKVPDTRPLITKLFGDGMRFIRRKDLAVIYDKSSIPQRQVL